MSLSLQFLTRQPEWVPRLHADGVRVIDLRNVSAPTPELTAKHYKLAPEESWLEKAVFGLADSLC